jgi:hypothetical protein
MEVFIELCFNGVNYCGVPMAYVAYAYSGDQIRISLAVRGVEVYSFGTFYRDEVGVFCSLREVFTKS